MYSIIKTFTLSILMCFQVSAFAQTETTSDADVQAQEEENAGVEKITVTGSHIKRIQVEGPSPIQVLDREQMERTGYNSVSDVLRDVTASSFGGTREASGRGAAGAASVSLRGLGANRTLVLMDGRRIPVDPLTASVDLNNIPFDAVERIEILKDGASALYGSDAVGGVVNIIMKKDFTGQSVAVNFAGNTRDISSDVMDGSRINASYTYGTSGDKLDLVTVVNYRRNQIMFARDRESTENGESTIGDIPSVSTDSGATWTPDASCPADRISDEGFCLFNFNQFASTIPNLEQFSLFSEAKYHVTPVTDIYARVTASHKKVDYVYAPAPGLFNTGGANRVRYRVMELGNRISDFENNSAAVLAGFRTEIFSDWELEADVSYSFIDRKQIDQGFALKNEFTALVTGGQFVPADPAGTRIKDQAAFDAVLTNPFQNSESSILTFNTLASGSLTDDLSMAVGVQYFKTDYSTEVDAQTAAGNVFSTGAAQDSEGDRSVYSVFSELSYLPLDNLELQFAARFDDFDDFGSTINPKLALRYTPTSKLMIRSSVGTGFKAPDLQDLYGNGSFGFPTFIDQVYCDAQGGNACKPQQYFVESPTNSELEEETFISANLGFLYQLTRDHSFGLDFFYLEMDNVVSIDYEDLTRVEAEQGVGALNALGITTDRDGSGRLTDTAGIVAPLLNLSELKQFGVDVSTQHKFGFENFGSLNIQANIAYLFSYKEQRFPGAGFRDTLQEDGQPAWRANIIATLAPKALPMTASFGTRWVGEHECAVSLERDPVAGCNRNAYAEFDLQGVYKTSFGDFSGGVQNILDSTGPLDSSDVNNQLDGSLYNLRGRTFFLGYRMDID